MRSLKHRLQVKANILLNRYFRKKYGTKAYKYPISLQIEVTNRCNLKCTFCEHSFWKVPEVDIPFARFKEMLDPLPPMNLFLSGIGESLLNRDFVDMLAYAKSRGFYLIFTDNATLLTDNVVKRIVEIGVDVINFSIDSVDPERVAKIRVNSSLPKVLGGIKKLADEKVRQGKKIPLLHANTVIMRENFREFSEIVRTCASVGITHVTMQEPIEGPDRQGLMLSSAELEEFKTVYDRAMEVGRGLNVTVQTNDIDSASGHIKRVSYEVNPPDKYVKCTRPIPWESLMVLANGDVWPCCWMTQAGDRPAHISVGNVYQQSIAQIWNGPRMQSFRRANIDPRIPVPDGCAGCRYLSKDAPGQPAPAVPKKESGEGKAAVR